MTVSLDIDGLDGLTTYFEGAPDRAKKAASLSLNQTADRVVVPRARDLIQEQIAFPTGYVNKDRLFVSQRSSPSNLEVKVKGRDAPTSLIRFATVGADNKITSVTVQPGGSRPISRGFAITLRNGNRGFAVRLPAGQTLQRSRGAKLLGGRRGGNVYLLYGPSVNQAFLSVADDITPEFLTYLSSEFLRQFARDSL